MTFATYPSLAGKPILITGGATGIGADLVRAFDSQGAKVGFVDIQDGPAADLVAELDGRPVYVPADVTDLSRLREAISAIAARIGPARVLVNNAASDRREDADAVADSDWDLSQSINLRPHFFAAQAVRPGMAAAGGGAIINFSSVVWKVGGGDMVPYTTAKAAILGLTKSLALAFGDDNIRVNAIEPGAVMTPRQRELWYPTEASVQTMVDRQALKRVLTGDEIARTVLFLASDDARMITRQSFVVDAGLS